MKKNVRLFATKEQGERMSIYIDCSGERTYLMPHRYVPRLYNILKDGIRLNDLKRCQSHKLQGKRTNTNRRRSRVLENSITHLIRVAEEFVTYEIAGLLDVA